MNLLPHLPRSVAYEVFAELCASLPPPREDTGAARDARDTLAMTEIESLQPVDSAEAVLALRIVLAEAHARACLRLVSQNAGDLQVASRCRGQVASLMREADSARRALRLRQAERPRVMPAPVTAPRSDAATPEAAPPPPPEAVVPARPEPEVAPSEVAPSGAAGPFVSDIVANTLGPVTEVGERPSREWARGRKIRIAA